MGVRCSAPAARPRRPGPQEGFVNAEGSRPHEFPRTGEHKKAKKSTPIDNPRELPRTARAAPDATECAGQVNWQEFVALAELASSRARAVGDLGS